MAAMFYILSMLLYAIGRLDEDRPKRTLLFSGAVVSGILALGSKEIAATLPLFIFMYEWFFFQDLKWDWFKKKIPLIMAMGGFLILLSIIYFRGNPLEQLLAGYTTHHLDMFQRVLSQFRVMIFYISLLIWPHPGRLNLDHDFPPSYTLVDPISTVFAIVALLALLGLASFLAKKERLISFCILWYLGAPLGEMQKLQVQMKCFQEKMWEPPLQ